MGEVLFFISLCYRIEALRTWHQGACSGHYVGVNRTRLMGSEALFSPFAYGGVVVVAAFFLCSATFSMICQVPRGDNQPVRVSMV